MRSPRSTMGYFSPQRKKGAGGTTRRKSFYFILVTVVVSAAVVIVFNVFNFSTQIKSNLYGYGAAISNVNIGARKPIDHHDYEPFNTTNPHSSWCPYATCQNSPFCRPCSRRYILIVATGRSGSTTVLKMINKLPRVRLSGENRNLLGITAPLINTFDFDDPSKYPHGTIGKKDPRRPAISPLLNQNFDRVDGPFSHNAIPPQSMSCAVQHAFNVLNPPPQAVQHEDNVLSVREYDEGTILGFKTIRLQKNDWTPMYAAKYIKEVFPCSKVIFNIRTNATEQVQSVEKTFHSDDKRGYKTEDDVNQTNKYLLDVSEALGKEMATVIDLSQWKDDVNIFNTLVDWLGFRNCHFNSIVHENVNGFGRDNTTDVGIDEKKCQAPP